MISHRALGHLLHRDCECRGRDEDYSSPTGSREAVARPPFPQNPACRFPAPGSSAVDSQHCECLQLPVREAQLGLREEVIGQLCDPLP